MVWGGRSLLKVLIADDEINIILLIKSLIDRQKTDVEIAGEAGDGITALEMVRQLKPDVVITDIRMPVLNGLELVEKCLRHDDIPCLVTGREDFLDDPAVRGALGFLRSLVVPADNAALESALRLLWNCPADLIQKAQTLCQKMGTLDSAALQEAVRGHGILENWLDRTEVWLPLVQTETPRKLVEQWEEQYGTSPALERLRNTAVFHEDFDSLWDALVLGQEADLRRASGKHWASGAVRLMTLHGAKGLEFPAVFLAGLSAGAMPLESPGRPADAEEERRLFFVGLTRAREELILTAAPEFSPFLRELPEPVVRETTGRRRVAEQLRLF